MTIQLVLQVLYCIGSYFVGVCFPRRFIIVIIKRFPVAVYDWCLFLGTATRKISPGSDSSRGIKRKRATFSLLKTAIQHIYIRC